MKGRLQGILCLILIVNTTLLGKNYQEEELIFKYQAPKFLADALVDHEDFLKEISKKCSEVDCKVLYQHLVWSFDSLPDYFVKLGVGRIKGREIIAECIEKNQLGSLTVPAKYLFHIPGRGTELTDENYVVLSKKEKSAGIPLVINLEEAKQICMLIRNTGFFDFHPFNIIRNENHLIAIIDTETINSDWGKCLGVRRILTCGLFDLNTELTEDALKYVLIKTSECFTPECGNYREKYYEMLDIIKGQVRPYAWDYLGFFNELFPKPID